MRPAKRRRKPLKNVNVLSSVPVAVQPPIHRGDVVFSNLVRRSIKGRRDRCCRPVGRSRRSETPGLNAVASGGRHTAVELDDHLSTRSIVTEALQLAGNRDSRIKIALARIEHHSIGRPPHRLRKEIREQAVGRVDQLQVRDILDIGRIDLDRDPHGAQFLRSARRADGDGLNRSCGSRHLRRLGSFGTQGEEIGRRLSPAEQSADGTGASRTEQRK